MAARSESSGAGAFISSSERADRADAGDLGQASAALIGPMPGHQLGVDLVELRLQLRIFFGLDREQLARQGGQRLIGLNALEQRLDRAPAPWRR